MSDPDRTSRRVAGHLADAHAIELQARVQMRRAPRMAGDAQLARAFEDHLTQTEEHERQVRAALAEHGASASRIKDLAGCAGGWAMAIFPMLNPDTPGKLAAHAFSYEHMEHAAYALLEREAAAVGDEPLAALAQRIGAQEREMAQRIADRFDGVVDASLEQAGADDAGRQLIAYLRDAHAIEGQGEQLMSVGAWLAGRSPLGEALSRHLEETREHRRSVADRLRARGSGPSTAQDVALRAGAVGLGAFFAVQPDTRLKLAGFAYAFEHLEIASYELLRRVAERADDEQTVAVAERILGSERAAADALTATWDELARASIGAA